MQQDRILSAVLMRVASAALFSGMNLLIKLAEARGAALGEILFFRQAGATATVVALAVAGPGLGALRSERMGAQVLRAAMGLATMAVTFAAVMRLQLAEATTINFTMPIFATVLGALFLGEPTGWRRWAAVLAGFAGVVIVAGPAGGGIPPVGAALGLVGAFGTACVSILLRQIGRTERAMTTVFWFSALSTLAVLPFYLVAVQRHPLMLWAMLAAIGMLGGVAQIAMTESLSRGPVSVVVPIDYTALIWATLLGWLVLGSLPAAATWVGAPVIIGSGLFIVWREHVRRRTETLQAAGDPAA